MFTHQGLNIWFDGTPGSARKSFVSLVEQELINLGAKCQIINHDLLELHPDEKKHYSKENSIRSNETLNKIGRVLARNGIINLIEITSENEEIQKSVSGPVNLIDIYVDPINRIWENERDIAGSDLRHNLSKMPHIRLHNEKLREKEAWPKIFNMLTNMGFLDDKRSYLNSVYKMNSVEKSLCIFPIPSLMLLRSMIRMSFKEAFISLVDDCMQFLKLRSYDYKHRVIFIAALPKSGSTWLKSMMGMVPGYHIRPLFDPSRAHNLHDISPLLFEFLPSYSYSVIKLHTKYSPINLNTILNSVDRFIVQYRDIRDMCISRYFHVLTLKNHRHHNLYKKLEKQEGIFHCINIIKNEYVSWINDWNRAARIFPGKILEVRYEDLNKQAINEMKRILSFFSIPYDNDLLSKMGKTQMTKSADLKTSLAKNKTQRKGIIGDYRNHFSKENKNYLKEIAGDLLVRLGYEANLDW